MKTALWANAVLLGGILVVLLSRGGFSAPAFLPIAHGEQPAIAGGAGVFIVTGQFSPNSFGCYLLDVDHQTIAAYRFTPGDHKLSLEAARNYRHDMELTNMNTFPLSSEIQRLVADQENQRHDNAGIEPSNAPNAAGPSVAPADQTPPVRSDGVAIPAPRN